MSIVAERDCALTEVRRTYEAAGLAWPPLTPGPIPLGRLIGEFGLAHEEVAGLNRAVASAYLEQQGLGRLEIPLEDPDLAGLLFANAAGGYILVRREDILPRRRKPSPKPSFLTSNSSMYRNRPLPLLGRFW